MRSERGGEIRTTAVSESSRRTLWAIGIDGPSAAAARTELGFDTWSAVAARPTEQQRPSLLQCSTTPLRRRNRRHEMKELTMSVTNLSNASPPLRRTTAVAGLTTLVLQLGGQALMQTGGKEPAFDASATVIAAFFAAANQNLFAAGSYLTVLSVVTFLWFLGGLYALIREDWRAPIALVCGVLYAAGAGVGWELAVYRVPDGIDPQLARLAFDLGNLSFASAWVTLGGFAIATGWIFLAHGISRRLGWLALAAGVCLIAARAVWTDSFWLIGYAMFWVWAISLCVLLLRAPQVPVRDTIAHRLSEVSIR